METATLDTELSIISRVVAPQRATFSPEVAHAILSLSFPQEDTHRMTQLADKSKEADLTAEEQVELESYRRVGHWLSMMKSKARQSLKTVAANS
jgi:uncharacterized protein YnzC (UPF0291/DUF896 family)